MNSGAGFQVNFIFLLFLLIPGYIGLRAYHKTYVQLDNHSRTDKLLLSALLGLITIGIAIVDYHVNLLNWSIASTNTLLLTDGYTAQSNQLWTGNSPLYLSP